MSESEAQFNYEITALSLDDYVPWPPTPEYKSKYPVLQAKRERTQVAAKKAAEKHRAESQASSNVFAAQVVTELVTEQR